MLNGYDNGNTAKPAPSAGLSSAAYEAEIKRILSTERARIDALNAQVADLTEAIQSKMHRLAVLDQEINAAFSDERARIARLETETRRLRDEQASHTDAAQKTREQALRDAERARDEHKAAEDIRKSLEMEQAVLRAKVRDLDTLTEELKEKILKQDSVLLSFVSRETAITQREQDATVREARVAVEQKALSDAASAVAEQRALLAGEINAAAQAKEAAANAAERLRLTQEERNTYEIRMSELGAKEASFAETERRLVALENRIKLDASALQTLKNDLDRRQKNIEQREAAAAKTIN